MRRYKESKRKRRKTFGRTAQQTHVKNARNRPLRGGSRL